MNDESNHYPVNFEPDFSEAEHSPHHGERAETPKTPETPKSLTIAISREAGSRGGSVAKRAGEILGWQVYRQEMLEFMAQEGLVRQDIISQMAKAESQWVTDRLDTLLREQNVSANPSVLEMARLILSLGANGDVVLLGRGAGFILPPETTLHVRMISPLPQRIAYVSQWMRLTKDEAAELIHKRDALRSEFIQTHFHRQPSDMYQYDLLLNSSLLGEEACAQLVASAARTKLAAHRSGGGQQL